MTRKLSIVFSLFLAIGIFAPVGIAQTTGFTYQGSLNSGGVVANGNHDFEFALFDAVSGGAQLGSTITQSGVAVTNGIFAVSLDFGSQFPGAQRFLEIRVRPSGVGAFTPLTPRQQITSAPYSVKSLNSDTATTATNATNATNATTAATATNALSLGGVVASGYLQTNGNGSGLTNLNASSITSGTLANARLGQIPTANIADGAVTAPKIASGQVVKALNGLTDNVTLAGTGNITVTPNGNTLTISSTGGGGSPILNQTTPQANANFNISGNGTAGGTLAAETINATTQFNLAGQRILHTTGVRNMFAGIGAGDSNTTGNNNTYFGEQAGTAVTTGLNNSFFGRVAGYFTTTGRWNTYIGESAGFGNIAGWMNTYVGDGAGGNATAGSSNTLVGRRAGLSFPDANFSRNTFLGAEAGINNFSGNNNVFLGFNTGELNTSGNDNTVVGYEAQSGAANLTNSTAIGSRSRVDQNNALVLGSIAGINGATASVNVGIGTTAPTATLHVVGAAVFAQPSDARQVSIGVPNGESGIGIRGLNNRGDLRFDGQNLKLVTGLGTGPPGSSNGLSIALDGSVTIGVPSTSASNVHVCFDFLNRLGQCSSSLRFKGNVTPFTGGLNLINRLRPIRYTWTENGSQDFGLGAEDVAKVEPLMVTHNSEGRIQGVKYDQLSVVLINAVKEQQEQIAALRRVNSVQQGQINQLKRIVCSGIRRPGICRERR